MATRVGPTTFCLIPLNRPCQHSHPLYAITACMACHTHPRSWLSDDVIMVPCNVTADFPQSELPCRERDHGWRRGNVELSQAILGSKLWALGGLNQKSKNCVLSSATWRDDGQKWLDSIEKQERRIDLREQRDKQTDRQSQRQKIIDSYSLGAEMFFMYMFTCIMQYQIDHLIKHSL